MKYKILIVEDKKTHMDALCSMINELNKDIEVYCAFDEMQAYQIAMNYHIRLFLVDIILKKEKSGDVTGLKFVQEIRAVKKYSFAPVIFITSLEDPKLYSYSQLHCFDYIEKPFDEYKVKQSILKCLDFPVESNEERYVYFRKEGIVYSQYVKDIIYIACGKRSIIIHSVNDRLEVPYKTCDEILRELNSDQFIRCSRFAIINKEYIEYIDYPNRLIKLRHIEQPVEIGMAHKTKFKRGLENGLVDL